MESLNRKIFKALETQCLKDKPYDNEIELFLNRSEYNTFLNFSNIQYIKDCYYKYNGNYWILRLVEEPESEPEFIVPVTQNVIINPLYYAHIPSELEMIHQVKCDIESHFEKDARIKFTIPQEFINEYKRLRQ